MGRTESTMIEPPTPAVRKNMRRQSHGHSLIEDEFAHALWARGVRYRRDLRTLPGSPDIAITTRHIAVFVDGEFWHGYDWEKRKDSIKSNRDFWIAKIERNMARDRRDEQRLRALGWTVIRFWGRQVSHEQDKCVEQVLAAIRRSDGNPSADKADACPAGAAGRKPGDGGALRSRRHRA